MKKTIVLLATASALVAGMASCKKEYTQKEAITQTINVSIKANESYTLMLPKNLRNDPYEIVSQATNFSISELGTDASGNRIYSYTPSKDYSGTDQVILSNDQEREEHRQHPGSSPQTGCSKQGPPPPGGPKCDHHHKGKRHEAEEDHYIIHINLTIKNEAHTTEVK